MKLSYLGALAALGAAITLTACGGKAEFVVQGTVTGLTNSGLILGNNGDRTTVAANATSFAFPNTIDYGTSYNIQILQQPDHMGCVIGGNTGSAGHTVSIAAAVQCVQNSYTVGGKYTGVTRAADGTTERTVTLLNGSTGGSVVISSSATASEGGFTFANTVPYGQAYGVTVVPPTNGLSCTLSNGTGVMRDALVDTLLLQCSG